jgi:DNA-binding transcriptional LysR family regulator
MELRQLEYFVAVAEEENFTRAAERVRISQSGVSSQIRQLEHDLGATLIDRSGRRATLTTAGAAALEHARAVLASADALRQSVDEVNGLIRGRFVVGMVMACTVAPFFDALAAFHRAHPGIEIVLFEDNSDRLIESVRVGGAHVALVGTAEVAPAGVQAMPIISEGLVAIVANDHPLANRGSADLAEITAFPIVCLPTGTGTRTVFDQACAAAGLQPEIALQASAPTAVVSLASRGLGVAILSESMGAPHREELTVLPIHDAPAPALLTLVWPLTTSPALREFIRCARTAFQVSPPARELEELVLP